MNNCKLTHCDLGAICSQLLTTTLLITSSCFAQNLSQTEFRSLGRICIPKSDRTLVTAIVRTESGFNPYALSINHPTVSSLRFGWSSGIIFLKKQPSSYFDAVRWSRELLQQGLTLSVGLLQVNTESGYPIEHLLNPCENLRIGWSIFLEKYNDAVKINQKDALIRALNSYNGSGRDSQYAEKVLTIIKGEK